MIKKPCIDKNEIARIFPVIKELKDQELGAKITGVWAELFNKSKWDGIEDACWSPGVNTQRLVDHINVTVLSALRISELIEQYQNIKFDRDIIITMGLLHDVSKIVEYEPDGAGGYKKSEIGEKIQHAVFGAISAYNMGLSLDIIHLILTHTPLSKMKPLMKEGILFTYVDSCDADMIHFENGLPITLKD